MNGLAERHWGLDWLRIGAFGLLILYHTGMVFVAWDFHIKSLTPVHWIEWPMLAANPWRMSLLFLVSGYATRHLLARSAGPGAFLGPRLRRLLLPLLFGVLAVVAPQPWVELTVKHGYQGSFWQFWARDYLRFGVLDGIVLPTWNHLWFLAYLAVYTLLVAGVAVLRPTGWQTAFDRLFGGARLWWLMPLWYLLLRTTGGDETHALVDDWYGHMFYLPAFLFGLGLAGSASLPWRLAAHWRLLLAVAGLAFAARYIINLAWGDDLSAWQMAIAWPFRPIQAWMAIAGLVGLATRHWNHDHPWRAPLSRAVFPWYVIHQTAIVLAAFWVRDSGWGNGAQFAVILGVTLLACWLAAMLARLPGGELLGGVPRLSLASRPSATPR